VEGGGGGSSERGTVSRSSDCSTAAADQGFFSLPFFLAGWTLKIEKTRPADFFPALLNEVGL